MKRLNMYFFDEERIHPLDFVTFYGILGGALLMLLVLRVVTS